MNMKENAAAYEPPKTKNIADLDSVSIDNEIVAETYNEGKENEFTINVIEVEGEKYRVPTSVIAGLKAVFEAKPDLTKFKVSKSGEGMNTKYVVIPLE